MAMNCQDFLEHATRAHGELAQDAAAHLHACGECRRWYAEVQPALKAFAIAGNVTSDVTNDAWDVAESDPVSETASQQMLAQLVVERQLLSVPTVSEDRARDCESETVGNTVVNSTRSSGQILGETLMRIAAAVIVVIVAISFLQPPEETRLAANPLPARLLDTNATLDSLGLVAACVEPQQFDIHTALLADHFGDLSCCTRCHQAANSTTAEWANAPTPSDQTAHDTSASSASPHLSEAKLNILAESCLLCHRG